MVLAKSNTPPRVSENADVFDWALDGADMEALRGLDRADGSGRSYWDNTRVPYANHVAAWAYDTHRRRAVWAGPPAVKQRDASDGRASCAPRRCHASRYELYLEPAPISGLSRY